MLHVGVPRPNRPAKFHFAKMRFRPHEKTKKTLNVSFPLLQSAFLTGKETVQFFSLFFVPVLYWRVLLRRLAPNPSEKVRFLLWKCQSFDFYIDLSCCMLKILRFTLYFANLLDFYANRCEIDVTRGKKTVLLLWSILFLEYEIFFTLKIGIFQHAPPIYDGNFNMHRKETDVIRFDNF